MAKQSSHKQGRGHVARRLEGHQECHYAAAAGDHRDDQRQCRAAAERSNLGHRLTMLRFASWHLEKGRIAIHFLENRYNLWAAKGLRLGLRLGSRSEQPKIG